MPEIGDSLGRYTLLKRLAAGGMGEVYLAAKPGPVGFGPRVALKILREQLASDQTFIDMLVDEANISMFLNHQNVVSVLDLAEDRGTYYIAMEFVQGVTVENLLERLGAQGRRYELSVALYIASELCRALKYAHTRVNHAGEPLNIIHRDVTPANILLSIQGEVKLTDFGIARAKGRIHQTQAGVLKGKFGYMAPEMIRYEAIDARADIFCAGVVIYLMITGRHPVAGSTVMEAIQRYEDKNIPRPSSINPEVPPSLDQIVMRALEPQPDNRWGSAAALAAALQDVVLKNPAWRRDVQDGTTRLSDLIREIVPEAFEDPVPAELAARLLRDALAREGIELSNLRDSSTAPQMQAEAEAATPEAVADTSIPLGPRPSLRRQMSGPVTDRAAEALEMESFNATTSEAAVPPHLFDTGSDFAPIAPIVNPELETEEGLALADVFAAREELRRESQTGVLVQDAPPSMSASPPPPAVRRGMQATLQKPRQVTLKKSSPSGSKGLPVPDTGDLPLVPEENEGDDIPTGVAPQEHTVALAGMVRNESGIDVAFPESSTDRHRLLDDMIAEPALPSSKATEKSSKPELDRGPRGESTVSGYEYEGDLPSNGPSRMDDGQTVVGMYALHDPLAAKSPRDTDENDAVVEPMREGALPEESPLDDGKTVMGMQIPDWADATGVEAGPPKAPLPSVLDAPSDPDATRGYAVMDQLPPGHSGFRESDDAETVIPLGGEMANVDLGEWAKDAPETNDATLLDGIDARALGEAVAKQRAIAAARKEKEKEPRVVTSDTELPPRVLFKDKDRRDTETPKDEAIANLDTDSDELNMDEIVASSLKTGKHASVVEKTVAGAVIGPALLSGPVRIAFKEDGSPMLGPTAQDSAMSPLPEGGAAAAAAVLASNTANPEPVFKKKPATVVRERKRPQGSDPPISASPVATPSNSQAENSGLGSLDVGTKTGRWMAGQIDAGELAWDDDAAARRAVATRNQGGASRSTGVGVPAYVNPGQPHPIVVGQAQSPPSRHTPPGDSAGPHPYPRPGEGRVADPRVGATVLNAPQPSALARNWPVIAALAAAFVAVGVVVGVLLFTRVLWPKLKLESDPIGASVIVDDQQVDGHAPVTVKVEPERPHSIEFRLEGYHSERREITDGVGRGRTYALQVSLRRIVPQLDLGGVSGAVFVNGKEVGHGARVALTGLPADAPVRLRVEAPGYRAWEQTFERGALIPESLDVPMTLAEKKEELPQKAPSPRKR